jgi:D-sedoheptulose 7-phosphate isomerase
MNFFKNFIEQYKIALDNISEKEFNKTVDLFVKLKKDKGRLFIIGLGGSAGNASHAVNDFRKLCNINAMALTDNVSEFTARVNDEGWENVFADWLKWNKANQKDLVLIFSVGGGNLKKKVSHNISKAIIYSKKKNIKIIGVVGKSNGDTYKNADNLHFINIIDQKLITPITESMQPFVWHMLVSHPKIQVNKTKW